jgi:ATP-dependent RNA helicase DeaD
VPFPDSHPALLRALAEKGYANPTEVQTAVLDPALAGRDLLVSSRTGSGKTVAFGLAIAPQILGEADRLGKPGSPVALVVAPTRELAMQVQRELGWLYGGTGARVVSCVGGMDIRREQRLLRDGAHVVVGTPGRLCDHLDRGFLRLDDLAAVVLDEADEMLDLGFEEELRTILEATPPSRRTVLFSATMPSEAQELARKYQKDAARVIATDPSEAHADIEVRAVLVAPRERDHAVVNLLRLLEPDRALVFCNTREGVGHLQANLMERGFHAVALSGDLSQSERSRALQALRDGRARVLVATDVAARGLDLPALDLVIHADLPHDAGALVHRSGRTGRAGRKGMSVLIVPAPRRRVADQLLRQARLDPIRLGPPTAEQIRERDQERLMAQIALEAAEADPGDLAVAEKLLALHPPATLVAALVRSRREQLPEPEDLPATAALHERLPRTSTKAPTAGEGVWFEVNIGRANDAHPQWLMPLLCRRGQVGREVIGRIEIGEDTTRFAIRPDAAQSFAEASRRPDRRNPGVWIRLLGE